MVNVGGERGPAGSGNMSTETFTPTPCFSNCKVFGQCSDAIDEEATLCLKRRIAHRRCGCHLRHKSLLDIADDIASSAICKRGGPHYFVPSVWSADRHR